jgi:hypothetical protein
MIKPPYKANLKQQMHAPTKIRFMDIKGKANLKQEAT